jgi:hypothetical protein
LDFPSFSDTLAHNIECSPFQAWPISSGFDYGHEQLIDVFPPVIETSSASKGLDIYQSPFEGDFQEYVGIDDGMQMGLDHHASWISDFH